MSAALLVIDVQQSFLHRPYWSEDDVPAFRDALTRLIEGCHRRGIPVVRVLHVEAEGAFSKASGWVRPMAWVPDIADHIVEKPKHSAMVATDLQAWLEARGITRLIVSGIRSEQCCETTTRNASDLGFEVDYITEATLTFPMQHSSGVWLSAADIKLRCETVLAGRFAIIRSVDEVLADLAQQVEIA